MFVWHDYRLVFAIVHFFEHMAGFSVRIFDKGISLQNFSNLFMTVLETRQTRLQTPMGLIEAGSIIVFIALLFRGKRKKALLILLLSGLTFFVQLAFGLRGHRIEYDIYIELWQILALFIGLQALIPWERPAASKLFNICLISLGIWSASLSLKDQMVPHQPIVNVCNQAKWYLPPPLAARFTGYCDDSQSSPSNGLSSNIKGFK